MLGSGFIHSRIHMTADHDQSQIICSILVDVSAWALGDWILYLINQQALFEFPGLDKGM